MDGINKKFQQTADKLKAILPDVDDSFWNFYSNTVQAAQPIAISLRFLKDGAEINSAKFHCLPSPHYMDLLALNTALEDLEARKADIGWNEVSINSGPAMTRENVLALLLERDITGAAKSLPRTIPGASEKLYQELTALSPGRTREEARSAYDTAKSHFAQSVTLSAFTVTWEKPLPEPPKRHWLLHKLLGR